MKKRDIERRDRRYDKMVEALSSKEDDAAETFYDRGGWFQMPDDRKDVLALKDRVRKDGGGILYLVDRVLDAHPYDVGLHPRRWVAGLNGTRERGTIAIRETHMLGLFSEYVQVREQTHAFGTSASSVEKFKRMGSAIGQGSDAVAAYRQHQNDVKFASEEDIEKMVQKDDKRRASSRLQKFLRDAEAWEKAQEK